MSYIPPPVIFGQPWFDDEEEALLVQTLRSGWIGQGPLVVQFEEELARYLGAPHVVAVSSCTAALHLSLVSAGIGPGDEVITTPFTFVATVNAIEHAGATPVLADIDPRSLNLDPERVAELVGPRTRAIVPVHFGGRPTDRDGLNAIATENDLLVVEDAAHALGAVHGGRRIGGSGEGRTMTCFSFYPNKNLATAEGGAIALTDPDVADRLRSLRLHGLDSDAWSRYRTSRYNPSVATYPGFKYNFTDLQAAIALGQLTKLEGFLAGREFLASLYDRGLDDLDGVRPVDRGPLGLTQRHALHLYQVVIEGPAGRRDAVLLHMRERNIGAAVHYTSVDHHPYYAGLSSRSNPHSDWASRSLLTLPLHLHMSADTVEHVIGALEVALRETA